MTTDNLLNGGPAPAPTDGDQSATPTPATPEPGKDTNVPPATGNEPPKQDEPPKGDDKKDDEPPAGAPEKYEFQAPEGAELDKEILGEFEQFARELNMPQEAAQKAVDLGVKMAAKWAEGVQEQALQQRNDWAAEVKADKELGGDKLAENLAVANAALKAVGSPELIELLNQTGLCNNIHVIRAFHRVGKQVTPDQFVGGNKGETKPDLATRLYGGSMGKK